MLRFVIFQKKKRAQHYIDIRQVDLRDLFIFCNNNIIAAKLLCRLSIYMCVCVCVCDIQC